ncbi:MAG: ribonuclease PH [Clostridia bacterium]|nr:ribonuclease PH [Clostridia bacterium]
MRIDGRMADEMREVTITTDFTKMAAGCALIRSGGTLVLCTASWQAGVPPFLKGKGQGWITAEYSMLPGSTPSRKPRDGIKKDGRSVEIQRLIGRSVRACCDLTRMGENTITLDCDVLQADGGTRTAAITGAFTALCLAVDRLMAKGVLKDSPIVSQLAAVSCGMVDGCALLDICYEEDSAADVDMNAVIVRDNDGVMRFSQVQSSGEEATFSREELSGLLNLAEKGVAELMEEQLRVLGDARRVIGMKPRLVLASSNFGKLREMKLLLGDAFDVVSMKELGIDADVEETGETFEENALIKARALCEMSGLAAVADDSGLEVDALGGRPGVHSARYSGVHGDDEANNRLLLKELDGAGDRSARYVCAMALVRPGRESVVVRGTCEGEILTEYRGTGGFGYDPLFFSNDLGMTFAQADLADKNRISHRAKAIDALKRAVSDV